MGGVLSPRLWAHLLLLRPLLRLVFGVNVRGREHLRELERFILVANHNSHMDALLLYSILPARRILTTYPVAARDYFARSRAVFTLMERLFDPIWVDRDHRPGEALEEMSRRLEAGGSVLIFPEGTRGEPGRMGEFKAGVGQLVARHPDVPVVPVFIRGPERSLPRQTSLPLPLWNHLIVGPPQRREGDALDVARSLREAIGDLERSESARRQRRRGQRSAALTVAALGIDGSGKSTLSRGLARSLSEEAPACLVGDALELYAQGSPRDMQPLLADKVRRWLGRQAKRAGSLAGYKVPKLSEMLLRDRLLGESERWYGPRWLVLDGSPLLNLTAWAVLYREECFDRGFCAQAMGVLSGRRELGRGDPILDHFPELRLLERLKLTRLRVPDAVLFLDVDPAVAVSRIDARGQPKQVHETEEKLGKLREAYLMVCEVAESEWGLPVRRLDGQQTIEAVAATALDFAKELEGAADGHPTP